MNKNVIYVISVFERMDTKVNAWDPEGIPVADIGCRVVNGWYLHKQDAVDIVIDNKTDLWETCYDYAVIEECNEGMYDFNRERTYYKYNIDSSKYKELDINHIPQVYMEPTFSVSGLGQ